MNQFKEHIGLKIAIFVLIAALITPSVVRFSHIFAEHEHEVCVSNQKEHFHEVNIDCELNKFKTSKEFTITFPAIFSTEIIDYNYTINSQYVLISDFQSLPFSLRGPPSLV